jgi:hypothetical protein
MSDHPFHRRKNKPGWRRHEDDTAKEFRGRRKPASGGTRSPFKKGDVEAGTYLFENKCTAKASFPLRYADLAKIHREARQQGKVPVLSLRFDFGTPKFFEDREWVILPKRVLKELVDGNNEDDR